MDKVLTKEKILGNNDIGNGSLYLTLYFNRAKQSMDEYANQEKRIEAIAFAEWMAIRGYKRSKWYQDRWYIPTTPQIVETNQPSTEQLYELFQKSK